MRIAGSRLLSEQRVWEVSDLLAQVPEPDARLVVTPAVAARVSAVLPYRALPLYDVPVSIPWLIVAGGGRLIDDAKRWRVDRSPRTRLVAIPTVWGSGAEASPIAVTHGGAKDIMVSPALRPDVRVRWPALSQGLPADLARWASGDAMTHAAEALLSPLGDAELRAELGQVLRAMIAGPADNGVWLDLSADACSLQSRASVGLVHGIAHVLEPVLWNDGRRDLAAHARLCTAWLGPVLRFNLQASPKARVRLLQFGVDPEALVASADRVGSRDDVAATLTAVRQAWPAIVRDRCTRTNVALVRPGELETLLGCTS